jgi:hypothetical protein
MPWIFALLREERVFDIQIAEPLHAIANGHLGKDPRTGQQLKNPETGKMGSYSLTNCVDMVLGRLDAKANDEWRKRYAELEPIPIEQWPQAAQDYPKDDARNTIECALAQVGLMPKMSVSHNWANFRRDDGTVYSACADCMATKYSAPCMTRRPHRNLQDVANQVWSAFALHAGAAWGFRVDQSKVDKIEAYALRRRAKLIQPFIDAGIVFEDSDGLHEKRSVLKKMVALAYGASGACSHCAGTGKIPSPAAKPIRCPACRGRCQPWKAAGKIKDPTVAWCETCKNTALVPNPAPPMINCVGADGTKTCDGTGLVLSEDVPRSEKDGISFGRDTLIESGDDFLMAYGYYQEDAKVLKDYVPYLRLARVPIAGHQVDCEIALQKKDGECRCPGPYRDVTLTLKPNVILETGRVSYRGYIQLFPRKPGFIDEETGEYIPSLRECIVPRGPRYGVVEVPDDYVLQPGVERVGSARFGSTARRRTHMSDRSATTTAARMVCHATGATRTAVSARTTTWSTTACGSRRRGWERVRVAFCASHAWRCGSVGSWSPRTSRSHRTRCCCVWRACGG